MKTASNCAKSYWGNANQKHCELHATPETMATRRLAKAVWIGIRLSMWLSTWKRSRAYRLLSPLEAFHSTLALQHCALNRPSLDGSAQL